MGAKPAATPAKAPQSSNRGRRATVTTEKEEEGPDDDDDDDSDEDIFEKEAEKEKKRRERLMKKQREQQQRQQTGDGEQEAAAASEVRVAPYEAVPSVTVFVVRTRENSKDVKSTILLGGGSPATFLDLAKKDPTRYQLSAGTGTLTPHPSIATAASITAGIAAGDDDATQHDERLHMQAAGSASSPQRIVADDAINELLSEAGIAASAEEAKERKKRKKAKRKRLAAEAEAAAAAAAAGGGGE